MLPGCQGGRKSQKSIATVVPAGSDSCRSKTSDRHYIWFETYGASPLQYDSAVAGRARSTSYCFTAPKTQVAGPKGAQRNTAFLDDMLFDARRVAPCEGRLLTRQVLNTIVV